MTDVITSHAIALFFPTLPSLSVVFPLTLICFSLILQIFARFLDIVFLYFLRLGFWAIILISILLILTFLASIRLIIFFKKNVDLLFLNFLLFGNKVPISPNFLEPKIESIKA